MTKKGYHQTEEAKKKSGLAQRGHKHVFSVEGKLRHDEASRRKKSKTYKNRKPRIKVICPICGLELETYINKNGQHGKYHRPCYLKQLGLNSDYANTFNKLPENRKKNSERVSKYYENHPEKRVQISESVKRLYLNPEFRENNKQKQISSHNTKEYREKSSNRMLKLLKEHPEKSGNAQLRRNKMTYLEKLTEKILIELGFFAIWNMSIRTNHGTKFPDFTLTPPIIIQCDGAYWHKNPEEDSKWDKALLEKGYNVLRFSYKEVTKDVDFVKNKIREAYSRYLLGICTYYSYWNKILV